MYAQYHVAIQEDILIFLIYVSFGAITTSRRDLALCYILSTNALPCVCTQDAASILCLYALHPDIPLHSSRGTLCRAPSLRLSAKIRIYKDLILGCAPFFYSEHFRINRSISKAFPFFCARDRSYATVGSSPWAARGQLVGRQRTKANAESRIARCALALQQSTHPNNYNPNFPTPLSLAKPSSPCLAAGPLHLYRKCWYAPER